jgi:hypothetical protein
MPGRQPSPEQEANCPLIIAPEQVLFLCAHCRPACLLIQDMNGCFSGRISLNSIQRVWEKQTYAIHSQPSSGIA